MSNPVIPARLLNAVAEGTIIKFRYLSLAGEPLSVVGQFVGSRWTDDYRIEVAILDQGLYVLRSEERIAIIATVTEETTMSEPFAPSCVITSGTLGGTHIGRTIRITMGHSSVTGVLRSLMAERDEVTLLLDLGPASTSLTISHGMSVEL